MYIKKRKPDIHVYIYIYFFFLFHLLLCLLVVMSRIFDLFFSVDDFSSKASILAKNRKEEEKVLKEGVRVL